VSLHPQDLDEVGHFRHLKIGRRSRARERKENRNFYQLPTINLKIKFTFRDRLNCNNCCRQNGGRRRRLQRVWLRDGAELHQGEVRSSGLSHWHCTQDDL